MRANSVRNEFFTVAAEAIAQGGRRRGCPTAGQAGAEQASLRVSCTRGFREDLAVMEGYGLRSYIRPEVHRPQLSAEAPTIVFGADGRWQWGSNNDTRSMGGGRPSASLQALGRSTFYVRSFKRRVGGSEAGCRKPIASLVDALFDEPDASPTAGDDREGADETQKLVRFQRTCC